MWNETSWNRIVTNQANSQGWSNLESWGRALIVGMSTYSNGIYIPCWRDLMIGGVEIWLEDWDAPHLTEVSGLPSGWIKKDAAPHTFNVAAYDEGLGVQKIRMISPGGKEWLWDQPWCSGTYENRCENTRSGHITFEASGFPYEGKVPVSVQAIDPTGKGYNPWSYELLVDGAQPTMNLSGQLAKVTSEEGKEEKPQGEGKDELSLPAYKLKIEATDGGSGVKEIKLFLDGSNTPLTSQSQSCSNGGCPMTMNYTLRLPGLSQGKHTLKVVAIDQVGNETNPERKIEFEYIPATGMKEEYVLQHIALPDGHDYSEEEESHGPEIAVNVMNGNLVYHERDVNVQGRGADLELERSYNSQLPAEKDTQWGHGWTLAQTPELKPQESPPSKATMLRTSGAITSAVSIPTAEKQQTFSPKLNATITKPSSGSYEVTYEGRAETSVFNSNGRIEETRYTSEPQSNTSESPSVGPTYVSAFGSSGSGNGQFAHPAGIAVTASGNLWAVDENHYRLEKFSESGEYLSAFGSSGSGNGQFGRPTDVAVAANGNLWVTDAGNNRLEEFNEKGEFLKAVGSSGSGNGQFSGPEALAIDSHGNIWVGDTYNARLQELNSSGEFIKVVSSRGSAQGQMIEPTGIAIGPNGNIWVADWGNQRVEEFSEAGSFTRQFGSEGTGNGQFKRPDVIEVDTKGDVWVGDQNNDRIQEFNQSGEYVSQFGSAGSGNGQFSFGWPMGLAADSKGNIWISDTGNNRVQKWQIPNYVPSYASSFGSSGTGNGQFAHPAGIAIATGGSMWVVDENNHRLEKFSESGEYLSAFGSSGSGNGQFGRPTDVAIAANGNLWVTDAGNNRLEEFNERGEWLKTVGSVGSGNGQFNGPEALAIDSHGNIWVGDTYNARLQELNENGEFIKVVSSRGSGQGQMIEPTGIAIGSEGNVWVADWGNQRVEEFSESGSFVRQFGSEGTGNGQFKRPDVIEVDLKGNVWVGDQNNDRIQEFNQSGEYVTKFGSAGTGNGQFSFGWPMGIATDSKGHLWISDTGNNRVQEFTRIFQVSSPLPANPPVLKYTYGSGYLTKMALTDPGSSASPSLNVNVTSGLVSSVQGEAAGTTSYGYATTKVTSKQNTEGETKYGYDSSSRLNWIRLPNGTEATIQYDGTSRATSVTVTPAGEASKTTYFWYGQEPRETRVWGGGNPEVVYNIGEDGSVFKWSYASTPPAISSISGSLWANRNSLTPVENKTQTLSVSASSPQEIASIQVLAAGSTVVAEKTCEDKSEPPAHNCEQVSLEWITDPAAHPAGELDLEVLATDFLGHTASERFFVTIPQQQPSEGEIASPPTFEEVKKFREENGLDPGRNENEVNQLILTLLYELEAQKSLAVWSTEEWGVPLGSADVSLLEERERYIEQDSAAIANWASTHAPSTYAGYYTDTKTGSIYVGFTENQSQGLTQLKQEASLLVPEHVVTFINPPAQSLTSLEGTRAAIAEDWDKSPVLESEMEGLTVDESTNTVRVYASNVEQVQTVLHEYLGAQAPITVIYAAQPPEATGGRQRTHGRIQAGDEIRTNVNSESRYRLCTAGFGAWEPRGRKANGETIVAGFLLTAAHCFGLTEKAFRAPRTGAANSELTKIGETTRTGLPLGHQHYETDGEAIRLEGRGLMPRAIYRNQGGPRRVTEAGTPHLFDRLCFSGVTTNAVKCGQMLGLFEGHLEGIEIPGAPSRSPGRVVWIATTMHIRPGDSGSPVWDRTTGKVIGLVSARFTDFGGYRYGLVSPLNGGELPVSNEMAPGILRAPGMGQLHLKVAK